MPNNSLKNSNNNKKSLLLKIQRRSFDAFKLKNQKEQKEDVEEHSNKFKNFQNTIAKNL